MTHEVIHGDCLEVMRTMDADSVHAIVTDPPYGLSFMGKDWDHGIPGVAFWTEALRVAKPGAHLLAFGGTRTFHRLTCAIEDAGWEVRDCLMWLYGSGFPKSLDISKAIDKAAGAEREVVGLSIHTANRSRSNGSTPFVGVDGESQRVLTAPATPDAVRWDGWGTALKPAWEPIILARKPIAGTVAANVLKHGCGGLNIDGCRVGTDAISVHHAPKGTFAGGDAGRGSDTSNYQIHSGRWPANVMHDGSDEVLAGFPEAPGQIARARTDGAAQGNSVYGALAHHTSNPHPRGDSGSAARFFYCAKASKRDRDEGLEGMPTRARPTMGSGIGAQPNQNIENYRNHHPTVKPTDLMRYLCRLVTPPNGTVLDPFTGSGSTGKAAVLEGFNFIGIEREAEYVAIARARIAAANKDGDLLK